MGALRISTRDLPPMPLDAAAAFHSDTVPAIREALHKGGLVVVLFSPTDRSHRAWRLAAIQELAREAAPARVNAIVVSNDAQANEETVAFLEAAPGVTGQVLEVASE